MHHNRLEQLQVGMQKLDSLVKNEWGNVRGLIRNVMHILIVCRMTVQHFTKTDVHAETVFQMLSKCYNTCTLCSAGEPTNPDEGKFPSFFGTLSFIESALKCWSFFSFTKQQQNIMLCIDTALNSAKKFMVRTTTTQKRNWQRRPVGKEAFKGL